MQGIGGGAKSAATRRSTCRRCLGDLYRAYILPMAALDLHRMRWQPIYAFFEEDSTLDCFPAWQREYLRYGRDGG